MARGARWAAVHGVAKSWTQLNLLSTAPHSLPGTEPGHWEVNPAYFRVGAMGECRQSASFFFMCKV